MERTLDTVAANRAREFDARHGVSGSLVPGLLESFPVEAVACFVFCQLALWTAVPFFISRSMPLDVVNDMLPWGHEWQLGYYKHPPLPAWLAEAAFDAAGNFGVYLLSQVCVAATLLFVFHLGRRMMEPKYAAVGTLLLAGVYYFSVPTPEFNNNVAQMPFWAGAAWALHRALYDGRLRYWIALGAMSSLGLLSKYSTAMLVVAMLAYTVTAPDHRAIWKTAKPYIAVLTAALVFLPHFIWLVENRFVTLGYAQSRAGSLGGFSAGILGVLSFVGAQAADHLPALGIAGASGALQRNFGRGLAEQQQKDFRFLLFMGLGPAMLSIAISLCAGLGLRSMWGVPMWNLSGLIIMLGASSYRQDIALGRLSKLAVVVFTSCLCVYVLAFKVIPDLRGRPSRLSWPQSQIARTFSAIYADETGAPLRIVGGDDWLAGLIAMRAPTRPSVFSEDDFRAAPWITPQRIARDGMLVVWRHDGKSRSGPPHIPNLKFGSSIRFAWPPMVHARPLIVDWGIVPRDSNVVAEGVHRK